MKLIETSAGGLIPGLGSEEASDAELKNGANAMLGSFRQKIESYKLNFAIEDVMELVRATNRYIESNRPWDLAKNGKKARLGNVLYNSAESLRLVAALLSPVMPEKCRDIRRQLGIDGDSEAANALAWGVLKPGVKIGKSETLFPRLAKEKTADAAKFADKAGAKTPNQTIAFDDFGKIELRTAIVLSAERVQGADKLLKLQIDLGDEKRQIVAGIAQYYTPEDMVGKTIIVVANLQPAKIRGVESNGMLLAAKKGDGLVLLSTDKDIEPGAKIS